MSTSERQLAMLEASITRRVGLQHAVVYWTIKDKRKRVLGGLNIMSNEEKAAWKRRVLKGISMCDHILQKSCVPKIKRAKRLLKKAIKKNDRQLIREISDGLIELGIMYTTVRAIAETGYVVYDATFDQYASIPIPGFDPPPEKPEDSFGWLPVNQDEFENQRKKTHAVTDRMDEHAREVKTLDEDIPTFEQVLKDVDEEEDFEVMVADNDDNGNGAST